MIKIITSIIIYLFFWIGQPTFAMTDTQYRAEKEFSYKENKLYNQWKAKPYGCLQPKKLANEYSIPGAYDSKYENVCIDGMTDTEHGEIVKIFEPYLKNPSRFYDKLWIHYKENIVNIKQGGTTTTLEKYVDGIIKNINRYKDDFLKDGVSQKTLKDFIQKKANEVDVKLELQKKQAIKQKVAQEKRKQEKLVKDTISPFAQYINTRYNKYFYNAMQEHYLKILLAINDPKENFWETELDKNATIINTASDFADYILEGSDFGSYDPSLVVKKGQEDALRDAIMEDVMKRYPDARKLYEQVSQK